LLLEQLPRAAQLHRDRPRLAAQRRGGLLAAAAFEDAEGERCPVLRGQPLHLLVQHGLQLAQGRLAGGLDLGRPCGPVFVGVPSRHGTFRSPGHAEGGPVQPARQRLRPADLRRLPRQHQERRLEHVLGVVLVSQAAAGHGPDEGGVAPQQRLEGAVVAFADEAAQQLRVGFVAAVRRARQQPQHSVAGGVDHGIGPQRGME
jgi:hypothetical protein